MQPTTLADVLIDDVTWGCATRPRRAEWAQAIAELREEASFAAESGPLRAYVSVLRDGIEIAVHDPLGRRAGGVQLPQAIIAPLFREYMGIIREMMQLGSGANSPRFEALDIAKRLTHDDAAETLQRLFHDVQPDHATARRLFTLLVLLTHDTTKMGPPQRG